jgi:hypothetical protein
MVSAEGSAGLLLLLLLLLIITMLLVVVMSFCNFGYLQAAQLTRMTFVGPVLSNLFCHLCSIPSLVCGCDCCPLHPDAGGFGECRLLPSWTELQHSIGQPRVQGRLWLSAALLVLFVAGTLPASGNKHRHS